MVTKLQIHQQDVKSNIWNQILLKLQSLSMYANDSMCFMTGCMLINYLHLSLNEFILSSLEFNMLSKPIHWISITKLYNYHIYKCISLLKFFLIYLILFEFCLFFHFSPSMYLNFITKGLLLTLLHTFISCFALNSLLILNKKTNQKNLLLFFVLFCF